MKNPFKESSGLPTNVEEGPNWVTNVGKKPEGAMLKLLGGGEVYTVLIKSKMGVEKKEDVQDAKNKFYSLLSQFPEEVAKCNDKTPEEALSILEPLLKALMN